MSILLQRFRLLAMALALAAAAEPAPAAWPLGSSDDKRAKELANKGNADLQSADAAKRGGDNGKASELYQTAAASYREAEQLKPDMEKGLIRIRLAYCMNQLDEIAKARAKPPPPVEVTHPPREQASGAPVETAAARTSEPPAAEPVDTERELAAARKAVTGDRPEQALTSLVRVLKADPANRQALLLMATLRVQQGRYSDAVVAVEELRGSGEDTAVLMLAAAAYCGAGRFFDALLALDQVLKRDPDLPQAHLDMAYLLLEMSPDKRKEADLYYQHALKLGVPRDATLEKRLQ